MFSCKNYKSIYDKEKDIENDHINKLKQKYNNTRKLKIIVSKNGEFKKEKIEEIN